MKTNSAIRLNDLHNNINPYNSAAKEYYACQVVDECGNFEPCLLTKDAIVKGIDRAKKNPEDVISLSLFLKFYHWILNFFE
jgi:hypothetical protein